MKEPTLTFPPCLPPSRGDHRLPGPGGEQRDQRAGQHAEDPGPHPHHHHRHVRPGRLPGRHLWRGAVLRLLARRHVGPQPLGAGELQL